jgi:hypothetical protein
VLLVVACLAVVALAIGAVARTPAADRGTGPLTAAAVVLALPLTIVVFFFAPWAAALALLALALFAVAVRARPGRPRAPRPRRPRA